jgi:hypothetical protein
MRINDIGVTPGNTPGFTSPITGCISFCYHLMSLLQCATIWKCEQRLSIENTDEICYKIILGKYFFG